MTDLSTHKPQQGVEILNCPSLGGFSVETEISTDNAHQLSTTEEQEDHLASSRQEQAEQADDLCTWKPFGMQDGPPENTPQTTCNQGSASYHSLYGNSSQPYEDWGAQMTSSFPKIEISRTGEPFGEGAMKHASVNESYNFEFSSNVGHDNQGPSKISFRKESSSRGPTAGTKPHHHYCPNSHQHCCPDSHQHCCSSYTSTRSPARLPTQVAASGEIDGNAQQWLTSDLGIGVTTDSRSEARLVTSTVPSPSQDPPLSLGLQISNETGVQEEALPSDEPKKLPAQAWPYFDYPLGSNDVYDTVQNMAYWDGEGTSRAPQLSVPFLMNPETLELDSLVIPRWASKDEYLVQQKRAGLTYKEIKSRGQFVEAESTLRGRYRNLTKRKEERVRRPEWEDADVSQSIRGLGLLPY